MILRFCSGSVDAVEALEELRRARRPTTSGMLKWPRNSSTTCSASPARSRPLSTKTQVSCRRSPCAAAAPRPRSRRRRRARRSPGRRRPASRMRAIAASRNAPCVQSPRQPATRRRKFSRSACAARRVHHLGVELHAVDAPLVVGDRGEGRAVRGRDHAEARRQRRRPCRRGSSRPARARRLEHAVEQGAAVDHVDERAAELAVMADLDLAAELRADGLLAVADAEHRHAQLEHRVRRARRRGLGGRGRAAGQDDRLGRERADRRRRRRCTAGSRSRRRPRARGARSAGCTGSRSRGSGRARSWRPARQQLGGALRQGGQPDISEAQAYPARRDAS